MAPIEPGEIDGSVTDVPGGVASSSDLVSTWRSAAYASSSLSRAPASLTSWALNSKMTVAWNFMVSRTLPR